MKPSSTSRYTHACLVVALLASWLGDVRPVSAQSVSVTSTNPSSTAQGTVNLDVTVNGKGFKKGAAAKWFVTGTTNPGGVTVNSTAFVDSGQLTANITVASDAAISGFDVVVANAGTNGGSGKGTDLFSVIASGSGSVMSTVQGAESTGTPTVIQSDGAGSYTEEDGITSQIEGSTGDWDLFLNSQNVRTVHVTNLQPANGSKPSPVTDGYSNARVISRCFDANNNITGFSSFPPGMSNNLCSFRVGGLVSNGIAYLLVMSPDPAETPNAATGTATVTCTAAGSGTPCSAWTVVPYVPCTVGATGCHATVAALYGPGKGGKQVLVGTYYVTYRVDVQR